MKRVQKVFAYITSNDAPARLLVLEHPGIPEAGIQVPAGTVELHEDLSAAVMREAYEETGLTGLQLQQFLGTLEVDMSAFGRAEIHVRHFFHLLWSLPAGAPWRHAETSGGKHAPIEFELSWVALPDVPALIADHGALLHKLNPRTLR